MTSDALIHWPTAEATARRLVRAGPVVSRRQAEAAVAELRRSAERAQGHVSAFTKLEAGGEQAPVLVVDRPGWITANVGAVRALSAPLAEKVDQWREGVHPAAAQTAATAVGARVAGVELGSLLAYLSHRVLGQYDAFGVSDGQAGRLLLVAPNIVQVERQLGVDPTDFRMWVCLHEETHRVQFGAVPWLRDHILGEIGTLIAELEVEPSALLDRLRAAVRSAMDASGPASSRHADEAADRVGDEAGAVTRGRRSSLLDVVRTPGQRAVVERLTAVMTLLEGHASFVMDGVGPLVVPSVAEISREFGRRRSRHRMGPEALLRRVIGLDAKMRQYRDGERFVRTVVGEAGMDGFNRVWTSPNTLPTRTEISDPTAWIRRVPLRRG